MSCMIYKSFIIWVFWVTLFGCTTQKKAVKYFDNHNTEAASYCSDRFPVQETIDTITILDTSALEEYAKEYMYMAMYIDSVLSVKCDTSSRTIIRYVINKLPSKPCPEKIITKQVESTARYQVLLDSCAKSYTQQKADIESKEKNIFKLTSEVNEFKGKFHAAKDERNKLRWLILLLLGILFRKQILRGARKIITKI